MRTTKSSTAVLTFAVILFALVSVGLLVPAGIVNAQKAEAKSAKALTSLDLTAEARGVAKRLADHDFRKCGGFYYTVFARAGNGPFQFDGVSFGVAKNTNFTKADQLNGIQWMGFATFTYSAYRVSGKNGWEEWKQPELNHGLGPNFENFLKRGGEWFVTNWHQKTAWNSPDEEIPLEDYLKKTAAPPPCESILKY